MWPTADIHLVPSVDLPGGPVASLVGGPGGVTLGLPGRARVTVAGGHVAIEAAAASVAEAVLAELGPWITGQSAAQAGDLVLRGTCVARAGQALVLSGFPRSGCSLVALALIRRGWVLVADGVVVLRVQDDRAWARPGRPTLELDPGAPGIEWWGTARRSPNGHRLVLDVATVHADVAVDEVVLLVPRDGTAGVEVLPTDPAVSRARLGWARVPDLSGTVAHLDLPADLFRITTIAVPHRVVTPGDAAAAVLLATGLRLVTGDLA